MFLSRNPIRLAKILCMKIQRMTEELAPFQKDQSGKDRKSYLVLTSKCLLSEQRLLFVMQTNQISPEGWTYRNKPKKLGADCMVILKIVPKSTSSSSNLSQTQNSKTVKTRIVKGNAPNSTFLVLNYRSFPQLRVREAS